MISTLCADTKFVFPHLDWLDCRHAVSLRCSNPCLITECDSNTAKYCPVSTHVQTLGQLGLICPASSRIAQAPCFATIWQFLHTEDTATGGSPGQWWSPHRKLSKMIQADCLRLSLCPGIARDPTTHSEIDCNHLETHHLLWGMSYESC